jgi:hypothetical protein
MATTRTRTTSDEILSLDSADMVADFGDRRGRRRKHRRSKKGLYGLFGDVKRRLKRPYLRKVVRSGRKLTGHHKIGHVGKGARGQFRYVTRGGSVYAASVSKKRSGGRKPAKKGSKRGRKK